MALISKSKTANGLSPIKFALKENKTEYINLLFKHNVDLGTIKNPLFNATEYQVADDLIVELIEKGHHVNELDFSEKPLLFLAAQKSQQFSL